MYKKISEDTGLKFKGLDVTLGEAIGIYSNEGDFKSENPKDTKAVVDFINSNPGYKKFANTLNNIGS